MKKLLPFLAVITFLFACQKEQAPVTTDGSLDLKTSSFSAYKKFRNNVLKNSEAEKYCATDYEYTTSIYINGVEWQYPASGYEYLMYKGLTHFADANNDYFFAGLQYPLDGYVNGIGFGTRAFSTGYYPFTSDVQISIPDKNYTAVYPAAACFAIGEQNFANTDSIRIVLHKNQKHDLVVAADSMLSFTQLKDKLGLTIGGTDSVVLYSSIGKVSSFQSATVYNWDYYNAGTTEIYGLENAGKFTNNLSFGDGLIGSCSGSIDIYLHVDNMVYKCSTNYSIFYTDYIGSRKQLHIYR